MTAPQKYWITNGDVFAVVTGAADRDYWTRRGWTAVDEPSEGQVHVWHRDVEVPGRQPLSAVEAIWGARGWAPGPPPGSPHPLVEVEIDEKPAKSKDAAAKTTKPAAGGDEKE